MTRLTSLPTITQTAGDIGNSAGAAPNGTLMQGNPGDTSARANQGQYAPGNQNTSAQLLATQLANGSICTHSIPSNVKTAPGTDSLLAQMSRGQVILGQSTYGQSQNLAADGGASAPIAPTTQPVITGQASALTYPAPSAQIHVGD
jgi:hypothetical protein